MLAESFVAATPDAYGMMLAQVLAIVGAIVPFMKVLIGFSIVILFHELGHFTMAKLCGVRVDKLAIGFGKEVVGFTRGETRYALNILPLGGYVKMLGQEDFALDKEKEWTAASDPRSFTAQSVGRRALIVSAGVIMNLVFAALAFMIVFMVGMESLPAKVGYVVPDSPAERYGLQTGDSITQINGRWMDDFNDVMMAIALADRDATLQFDVQRSGKDVALQVPPEYNEQRKVLQVGIGPGLTRRVAFSALQDQAHPVEDRLRAGDTIVAIDGRKIDSFYDYFLLLQRAQGREVEVSVERPVDPNVADSATDSVTCRARANLSFVQQVRGDETSATLLGLLPRCVVTQVQENSPAEEAIVVGTGDPVPEEARDRGFEVGDVIIRWADLDNPTVHEIRRSIAENDGQELSVTIQRRGERMELVVRPQRPMSIFGRGEPMVGVNFEGQDADELVVADTREGWPVHDDLRIPRGARIVSVDSEPVAAWHDLVAALREHAGTTVTLAWEYGGVRSEGALPVPWSLSAALDLPGTAHLLSINGKSQVYVQSEGKRKLLVLPYWLTVQELCREALGEASEAEVTVEWADRLSGERHSGTATITPERLDPWLMRVRYSVEDIRPEPDTVMLQASNPVRALWIGMKKTGYFVYSTYLTIERIIISRTVGIERISGPVGIMKMGKDVAGVGIAKLLYFLAFISVSLAVINFLPLPIVDGGIMVFLIIEKIKGKPVSLRLQVITQLVGLALIIVAFVFITIQDIIKWNG